MQRLPLNRRFAQFRAAWFSRFHERLRPP